MVAVGDRTCGVEFTVGFTVTYFRQRLAFCLAAIVPHQGG
jgi:hypothetical protein